MSIAPLRVMSVIPLKADIHQRGLHVRFVPKADIVSREPSAEWSRPRPPMIRVSRCMACMGTALLLKRRNFWHRREFALKFNLPNQ